MTEPVDEPPRRPLVERLGLAAIAFVIGALFAVMGGIGCLMTIWVGGLTLFRG